MTRRSDQFSPFALLPDIEPLPEVHQLFALPEPRKDPDGANTDDYSGASADAQLQTCPRELLQAMFEYLPSDERVLGILTDGPLLPFDYCWLRGQRQALVPVVQGQLLRRNPRLCVVDRTPLGIDPNADLFRCFLMHGNSKEPVTVYTFYERHVCGGVVDYYFQTPDIQLHVFNHMYKQGWKASPRFESATASVWLAAYDKALDVLFATLCEAPVRERARVASEYAEWLLPMVRRIDLMDGVRTPEREAAVNATSRVDKLSPNRRIVWDWLGDFSFLSITSRVAFCAFARMRQLQFPNLLREDIEVGRSQPTGIFRPRHVWTSLVVMFIGLIIAGESASPGQGLSGSGYVFGVLPALAAATMLLFNLVFWLFYTSNRPRLLQLVPPSWVKGKAKNLGYLR